jgi:hypothetical protein
MSLIFCHLGAGQGSRRGSLRFFFIDDDHLCFAVGDVSGKGVPASLFMAVTKALFRATAGTAALRVKSSRA